MSALFSISARGTEIAVDLNCLGANATAQTLRRSFESAGLLRRYRCDLIAMLRVNPGRGSKIRELSEAVGIARMGMLGPQEI